MKTSFKKTKHFCESVGQGSGNLMSDEGWEDQAFLRLLLIFEELMELSEALGVPSDFTNNLFTYYKENVQVSRKLMNYSEVKDALGDLDVVVNNAAVFFEVDMDKISDKIYQSNMSKICETEEEAELTVKKYLEQGISTFKAPNKFGKWCVYNSETLKLLKSINFKPPRLDDD